MLCFLKQLVKAVCVHSLLLLLLVKASSKNVVGMFSGMRRPASTDLAYKNDVEQFIIPSAAQGHFCEEEILRTHDHIHEHA